MQSYQIKWPLWKYIIDPKFIPLVDNRDRYIAFDDSKNIASDFISKKLIFRCLSEKYFRHYLIYDQNSPFTHIMDSIEFLQLGYLFDYSKSKGVIKCVNGNLLLGVNTMARLKKVKDPTGSWYYNYPINEIGIQRISSTIKTTKATYLQEIFTYSEGCADFDSLQRACPTITNLY